MRPTLPEPLLSSLADFLAAQIGLNFPRERWGDLERGIAATAREFGAADVESCVHRLLSAPLTRGQIEILASRLTVGETYFFREKPNLEALEQHVFPELLRARECAERRLRFWSAGCCTGEEPYSIAMLLDRLLPDQRDWNISILATDINPQFLRKAAEGVYGEWSFRDTPAWVRERYFKKRKDGRFEVLPHIRKRVTFSYLNLADDAYPSLTSNTNAMDVIFCRNVLMYFTAARAGKVVENLHRALVDGGWFVASLTESSGSLFSAFTTVESAGAILYRKTAGAERRRIVIPADSIPAPAPPMQAAPPGWMQQQPAASPPEPDRPADAAPAGGSPPAPGEIEHLRRTALDCANQGRLDEAIEWCRKAITADKLNPAHRYLLATIQQELGQSEVAVQSLMRALYLDPDFVLAHFALGNLRLSQGRHREAQRHFDNTLTLLRARPRDEILPEAEGLTAGRLGEIIVSVRSSLPQNTAVY
ncbi:MAG: CheR family methyltransferase [Acidobacteriota bacterium]|nr:CheR family methyltransferase [Acidobacteriota bacterium]